MMRKSYFRLFKGFSPRRGNGFNRGRFEQNAILCCGNANNIASDGFVQS